MNLNGLSPAALKAAMQEGAVEWGQRASANEHVRYAEPQTARNGHYLKCHCGCGQRSKWRGMANGICLYEGCELSVRRWAAEGKK